jgi:hypothetical protein
MILSEKKVWKVVTGEHPRPPTIEQREIAFAEETHSKIEGLKADASAKEAVKRAGQVRTTLTDVERARYQKEIDAWDDKD